MERLAIDDRALTYRPVGATRPELVEWTPPPGFRSLESTTRIRRVTAMQA
jgi:hypothetical protein